MNHVLRYCRVAATSRGTVISEVCTAYTGTAQRYGKGGFKGVPGCQSGGRPAV